MTELPPSAHAALRGVAGSLSSSALVAGSLVADLLECGLSAADPRTCLRNSWQQHGVLTWLRTAGRIDVLSLGKAAPALLAGCQECLEEGGLTLDRGLVVAAEGGLAGFEPPLNVEAFEAEHPLPGPQGEAAGRAVVEFVQRREARAPDSVLLVLLSGGTSAMLPAPMPGTTIQDEQRLTELLLRSGADIRALNLLRQRLSRTKGGRLAQASRYHRTMVMVLSDVVGDHLPTIASGPFIANDCRTDRVVHVAQRYLADQAPELADLVMAMPSLPQARDSCFQNIKHVLIGSGAHSLDAMVKHGSAAETRTANSSIRLVTLGPYVEGEAREVARSIVDRAVLELMALEGEVSARECGLLVVGAGETTVTVRGSGRGGRNQELALACALEWHRRDHRTHGVSMAFGALATDGRDGPTEAAGAVVDHNTISRLQALRVDAELHLERNDSNAALEAVDSLIVTGHSGTNVGDIFAMGLLTSPR